MPSDVTGGTAFVFNESGSHEDDGDMLTYMWDFGDGNTMITSLPSIV